MGQAQMSQWQRYSPSSKALLFGSWFASLDSLVQVHKDMIKERDQFYDLVAVHEEFSTFSNTELDAWWFQLNRVDHFITEYQFYKRTQAQTFKVSPQAHVPKEPENIVVELDHQKTADSLQDLSDIPIQTFEVISPETPPPIQTPLLNDSPSHVQSKLYPVDSAFDQDSADEDIILRPIKRRRKRSKTKLEKPND